jgi:hypothetical protein
MSTSMTAEPPLVERLAQLQMRSLIVGVVGLAAGLAAWAIWPVHFFPAYLTGFMYWIGVSLGCLGLTLLHHLVGGSWGLVIRRPLESGAMNVLLMIVLFVPLAFGLETLYPWARAGGNAHDVTGGHTVFLSQFYFLVRVCIYFGIWIVMGLAVNLLSNMQDRTTNAGPSSWLQTVAGPGIALLFLAATFAAVDWGMSLDAKWTSTIYGVMIIIGDALATMAITIVIAGLLATDRPMSEIATPGRLNDLGNLMLAFTMLWAYMSFCQFLIIWSGNLSEEIPWYIRRTRGGWEWFALGLIVCHFFLPFFILLFRSNKRETKNVMRVALWILFMHWVNFVWLVVPASAELTSPHIIWPQIILSAILTVGIGGIWFAFTLMWLKRRPLVPLHDPSLIQALEHAGGH